MFKILNYYKSILANNYLEPNYSNLSNGVSSYNHVNTDKYIYKLLNYLMNHIINESNNYNKYNLIITTNQYEEYSNSSLLSL